MCSRYSRDFYRKKEFMTESEVRREYPEFPIQVQEDNEI